MDTLESRKTELKISIDGAELSNQIETAPLEKIEEFINNFKNIKTQSDDWKARAIKTYIKRINLYPEEIEVNYIVDIDGCWTRIRTQTK